jgi:hypothetical protein
VIELWHEINSITAMTGVFKGLEDLGLLLNLNLLSQVHPSSCSCVDLVLVGSCGRFAK